MKMKPVLVSRQQEQRKQGLLHKIDQKVGACLSTAVNAAVRLLRWLALLIVVVLAIVGLYSIVCFYPELSESFRQTANEIQNLLHV